MHKVTFVRNVFQNWAGCIIVVMSGKLKLCDLFKCIMFILYLRSTSTLWWQQKMRTLMIFLTETWWMGAGGYECRSKKTTYGGRTKKVKKVERGKKRLWKCRRWATTVKASLIAFLLKVFGLLSWWKMLENVSGHSKYVRIPG